MITALLTLAMPLLLNEVLANEPGSVVSLEWIELAASASVGTADYSLEVNGEAIALPDLALDSGQFLVVCRDTMRFEAHYGDSSGAWGDHAAESYPRWQADFSLANSAGQIRLSGAGQADSFGWSTAAPDGVSFERIGDSLWQVTTSPPGATPGARNQGAAVAFDWALAAMSLRPPLPRDGEMFTLHVRIENRGSLASTTRLAVAEGGEPAFAVFDVAGDPTEPVEFEIERVAQEGLNRFTALLDPDERAANNEQTIGFFGSADVLRFSEVFGAPAGSDPEWLEFYLAADSAVSLSAFTYTNGSSAVPLDLASGSTALQSYLIVTPDSVAFRRRYGNVTAPVLESAMWPTLNNSGDTLLLHWGEHLVDRVAYPSFGSRRGVSLERIGDGNVWGLSAAPNGATPGAPNSIDVPYSDKIALTVAPNPFAARLGETAAIRFTVPFGATGELRLYAGDGRHLRTLYRLAPMVSGELLWDGRDAEGRFSPVGVYLVQLRISKPFEQARLTTVVIAR